MAYASEPLLVIAEKSWCMENVSRKLEMSEMSLVFKRLKYGKFSEITTSRLDINPQETHRTGL